ncbi:HU family DNA-binding protein [Candidatus Acetothermia bacterium]|nr:HU family DNA-binding protein [Candidatus Acetothermia bacterium]
MNKAELTEWVAKQAKLSKKDAYEAVEATLEAIAHHVSQGDEVRLTGFGTFWAKPRRASQRINPQTRQKISVGAKVVPSFRPGSELKERIYKRLKVTEVGGKLQIKPSR